MNEEPYRIIKDGHVVYSKKFVSVDEARKWGIWNFKGDNNFEVIHEERILQRKRATNDFLENPPPKLTINGHIYILKEVI